MDFYFFHYEAISNSLCTLELHVHRLQCQPILSPGLRLDPTAFETSSPIATYTHVEPVGVSCFSGHFRVAVLVLVLGRHVRICETRPTQIEMLARLAFVPLVGDLCLATVALHRSSMNTKPVFSRKQCVSAALLSLELTGGPTLLREPLVVTRRTRETTLLTPVVGVAESGRMLSIVLVFGFAVEPLANAGRMEVFSTKLALYQGVVRGRFADAKLLFDGLLCLGTRDTWCRGSNRNRKIFKRQELGLRLSCFTKGQDQVLFVRAHETGHSEDRFLHTAFPMDQGAFVIWLPWDEWLCRSPSPAGNTLCDSLFQFHVVESRRHVQVLGSRVVFAEQFVIHVLFVIDWHTTLWVVSTPTLLIVFSVVLMRMADRRGMSVRGVIARSRDWVTLVWLRRKVPLSLVALLWAEGQISKETAAFGHAGAHVGFRWGLRVVCHGLMDVFSRRLFLVDESKRSSRIQYVIRLIEKSADELDQNMNR